MVIEHDRINVDKPFHVEGFENIKNFLRGDDFEKSHCPWFPDVEKFCKDVVPMIAKDSTAVTVDIAKFYEFATPIVKKLYKKDCGTVRIRFYSDTNFHVILDDRRSGEKVSTNIERFFDVKGGCGFKQEYSLLRFYGALLPFAGEKLKITINNNFKKENDYISYTTPLLVESDGGVAYVMPYV